MNRIIIGPDRNCERPSDAASLLEEAAGTIRTMYESRKGDSQRQPFLVDAVTIDPYHGLCHIIFRSSDNSDEETLTLIECDVCVAREVVGASEVTERTVQDAGWLLSRDGKWRCPECRTR